MRKIISTLLIVAMLTALAALPTLIQAADLYPTPDGYSDHDYQKILAFALYDDNWEKLTAEFLKWDLDDVTTWYGITWNNETPRRVTGVNFEEPVSGPLDLSGFTALRLISIHKNARITSLNLSGCAALDALRIFNARLTSLDLSGDFPSLRDINAGGNSLRNINLSGATNLQVLNVNDNQLARLDLTSNTKLHTLGADGNRLTALDLSGNPALRNLDLSGNRLTELDISGNTDLDTILVSGNRLTALDLTNNPQLLRLRAENNRISAISENENIDLQNIDVRHNLLDFDDEAIKAQVEKWETGIQAKIDYHLSAGEDPELVAEYYYYYCTPQKCLGCEQIPPTCICCEVCGQWPCVCPCETCGKYPCACPKPPSGIPTNTNTGDESDGDSADSEYLKGDVNGDGRITSLDALLILQHVAGKARLAGAALGAADVDGDGLVGTGDAVLVLRWVVG